MRKIASILIFTIAIIFLGGISKKIYYISVVYFIKNDVAKIISSEVTEINCLVGSGKIGGNPSGVINKKCYVPVVKYEIYVDHNIHLGDGVDFNIWEKNQDRSKAFDVVNKFKSGGVYPVYLNKNSFGYESWLSHGANWNEIIIVLNMVIILLVLSYRISKKH